MNHRMASQVKHVGRRVEPRAVFFVFRQPLTLATPNEGGVLPALGLRACEKETAMSTVRSPHPWYYAPTRRELFEFIAFWPLVTWCIIGIIAEPSHILSR